VVSASSAEHAYPVSAHLRARNRAIDRFPGAGLRTFSIGFESGGGESGDEFAYSDLVARAFGTEHLRIPVEDVRLQPAVERAIAAMSEPMSSHDVVAGEVAQKSRWFRCSTRRRNGMGAPSRGMRRA
jgi:asparagine synthetase B (glutamine-hydrolysing)